MVFPDNHAKASGLAFSAAAARQGSVHVMETVRPKSIASQSVVRHGPVFGLLFFGVFLLVGSVRSYFRSTNNRIIWAIDVRGDIPRWPDLKEEFEIQVRPGARMATA